MARRFERTRRGVAARLDDDERALLVQLAHEVAQLLDDGSAPEADPLEALVGISEHAARPEDPALARLLPDASTEDAEAAGEFRRFTERGLRTRKREALAVVEATLARPGALALDEDEARAWASALTDVRLVLAERLGLRTDADAERVARSAAPGGADPEDPQVWLASVYDFTTWLQETLVGALAERLRHRPPAPPGLPGGG